jgi:2-oxoglutarate dehydrogenase E1 component
MSSRNRRVRDEDLADLAREANRHRFGIPESTRVVVQLGQSVDILRHLIDRRVSVLDLNQEGARGLLLRLPAASSTLGEMTRSRFRPVLDDPARSHEPSLVRRLVLCSGRLYYDLALSPRRAKAGHVAIARLELLYPFPAAELGRLVKRYPNLETVVWAQEEPRNMGARKFVLPELRDVVRPGLPITDVSRPERSSPAEGSHAAHRAEQARIVEEALTR